MEDQSEPAVQQVFVLPSIAKLTAISRTLDENQTPPTVTVREFLWWFGAQRRGYWIVMLIREKLKQYHLETRPDFALEYIDGIISFLRAKDEPSVAAVAPIEETLGIDPTYRIGKLASANRKPLSVSPDATLQFATTQMLTWDYSQLPVMTSEREVKGMISWTSVGARLALKTQCDFVRDCMDTDVVEVSSDTSLFDAIDRIVANEYVLVRREDKVITGIVTTSDLSLQFRQLGEPFLLLGEIENHIRRMIQDKFTVEELQEAKDAADTGRQVQSPADLTFGEYGRLLEKKERWSKLGLAVERSLFIEQLNQVRDIRNDVMHFDPDGIAESDLETLRRFVRFLQELSGIGAI